MEAREFIGASSVSLDGKNRIAISRKYLSTFERIRRENQSLQARCQAGDETVSDADVAHLLANEDGEIYDLVMTVNMKDDCLVLYPIREWNELRQRIDLLPSNDTRVQNVKRNVIGNACEVVLDKQGKMLIPATLKDYAKLQKKLLLVGLSKTLELWDADLYEQKREESIEEFRKVKKAEESDIEVDKAIANLPL